jgi:hypothetical protein
LPAIRRASQRAVEVGEQPPPVAQAREAVGERRDLERAALRA